MFVGHFAVGFGAKRFAPEVSAGTLVLAALLADVLFLVFLALGVEHVAIQPGITRTNALDLYDIALSHSLLMDVIWGALLASVYMVARSGRRGRTRGAWVLLIAVLSHWLLDWLSHRPDMPLAPGAHRMFGLGLYNSPLGMLLVEGGLWIAGLAIYARTTRARGWGGRLALWIGVALLSALWLLSFNGAPPPSLRVFIVVDLVMFPVLLGGCIG